MVEMKKNRSSGYTASYLPCSIVVLFIVMLFDFLVPACCYSGCYTCRLQIFGKDHCSSQSNGTLYLMTIFNDLYCLAKEKNYDTTAAELNDGERSFWQFHESYIWWTAKNERKSRRGPGSPIRSQIKLSDPPAEKNSAIERSDQMWGLYLGQ